MWVHYLVQFQCNAAPPYRVVVHPWLVFRKRISIFLNEFLEWALYIPGTLLRASCSRSSTVIISFWGPESLFTFLFWPSVIPWVN